ncbi:glycosyltransferase family 39 protein [soil metagenome]
MKKIHKLINSRFAEIAILFVILVGAFGVRLYKINNPVADWHAWRQVDTASVSRIFLDDGINLLYPRYYDVSPTQTGYYNPLGLRFVEFPIFNVVNVLAFKAFPRFSLEVWGRLISVFSAIGTTFFLYLIGKKLINRWGGLIAAFFYGFIPYNIYFTRVILPEPMAVFLTISSLWFFIVYTEKNTKFHLFLSAILFAAGMLLKPFILFYFPVYVFLYLQKFGWKSILKKVDIYFAVLIVVAPFCLWRIWINQHPVGIPLFEWLFNGNGIRFRPAFWRWIFGERLGYLILGIWGVPLFVFGLLKKQNWPIILSGLGMFLYVSVLADGNVQHDYYQIQIIPAIALMLASGIVYLWNSDQFNKWIARPLIIFCVGMMLGMGLFKVIGDYQVNHYEVVAAGMEADKILPKDAIVIAPYNGDTTFLYQIHRFGWPVVDRSFDELIKLGADYFVSVNYDADTNMLLTKYKAIEKNPTFVIIDLDQPLNVTTAKK